MELKLNSNDYEHISEKSDYNHNYYKFKGKSHLYPTEILEICHEDENYSEFYLIENDNKIFLGCSNDFFEEDETITINFRVFYT